MGLETATYISDLNSSNPTSSDAKSAGDDHIRLLKSTVKATFPNISGAVTPTHTELNYVDGVTSAIQTQIDTKGAHAGQAWTGTQNFTGATITAATQTAGDSSTKVATTAFVAGTAFSSALPGQTGNYGKFLTTDGSIASFDHPASFASTKTTTYTAVAGDRLLADTSGGAFTITLPASPSVGDAPILIRDLAGTFATSNLTLGRNSNKIEGVAEDFVIDITAFAGWLVWTGATYGWEFV